MQLAYAFLARSAEVTTDGTLQVLGGDFDVLQVESFPAKIPPFVLVAKFACPISEYGTEHVVSIDMTDPSGERVELMPPNKLNLSPMARDRDFGASLLVHVAAQFEEPGKYTYHILADEKEIKAIPLYLAVAELPIPIALQVTTEAVSK